MDDCLKSDETQLTSNNSIEIIDLTQRELEDYEDQVKIC